MGIYKAVVSTWLDGLDADDAIQITPTFRTETGESGLPALAQEILDKIQAYWSGPATTSQMRVKLYVADNPTPPNYPVAMAEENLGVAGTAGTNRDIALCLSYYGQFNRPRYRGRIYVPNACVAINSSSARPSALNQTKVGDLAAVLASVGGSNVTWGLYSKVANAFRPATHWWVDNAWDTQRRRGLAPSSRLEGTVAG